ncbi:MAG: PadR family transcriptional regulator [Rhodospirillaceae bacterium]|jgi:PadR family transcriptional regulator, regulatory protein AphA|nr:PadR family transcriptional regulator [Rhodospirillaceae bacterium]MBT4938910.1 PadR family transcriptional regulator [Rhodospirillaceae bacterium]MBT7956207.1 PadR family transcriptional regulator [Rhodospirillaceae bacterium]
MDIKSLCLGALSIGDASGYEIKKMFEEGSFSHFYDAGYGSIYPALNKLLAEDLVTCIEIEQEGRPAKKVYSLTNTGLTKLKTDLSEEPARDKTRSESIVMMFFGHLLSPAHRERVIESYIEHFRDGCTCIEEIDPTNQPYGRQFVRGLGLAIYQAAANYLEENKDLLLVNEEERDIGDAA